MGTPSRHVLYNKLYQQEAKAYRDYLLLLGYKGETCQSRYLFLKEFFNYLEEVGIYQLPHITAVAINDFYHYVQNRKSTRSGEALKQKTVYGIMRCVQMYLGYVLDLGKIKTSPASHLKFTYPSQDVERRVFTQPEIQQLYKAAETPQERAMLNIAYGCGLRVNEISQLNKEDLRLTENLIIVQKGKNGKRRLVPIPQRIAAELHQFLYPQDVYFSTETKNTAVFTNTKGRRMQEWTFNSTLKKMIQRTRFGNLLTAEELKKIGVHTLRHSIATHLLENGMKLEQVQEFLGHSHIESTQVYTHISQHQINTIKR